MLAGYDHLLRAAARLHWDAEAVRLDADRAALTSMTAPDRERFTALVAGFCLAEHAVAEELTPWVAATGQLEPDPAARECFAVQADDEARHARFFDRIATELLDLTPRSAADRAAPALRGLFRGALPAASRALADDATTLPAAVGLYHLVLEGIVFAVGQQALLELADAGGLRGVSDGVARVQGDERWHVGLGVLALQRLGVDLGVDAEFQATARRAIAAWGPRIATAQLTERVLAAHRRRLTITARRTPDDAPGSAPAGEQDG